MGIRNAGLRASRRTICLRRQTMHQKQDYRLSGKPDIKTSAIAMYPDITYTITALCTTFGLPTID
jgi:hypothetical protein